MTYYCFYTHCADKKWSDAKKAISGADRIDQFYHDYFLAAGSEGQIDDLAEKYKKVIVSSGDFKAIAFPERRKFLDPWVMEQGLILVAAKPGVGKTWFALSTSYAITRGGNFGPWQTVTPVPCLYIDGEMPAQDIQERLDVLDSLYGEQKEPLLILSDFYAHYLGLPKMNLKELAFREAIRREAMSLGAKLIIIDNLSSLCPEIDENSKKEWDPINQWLLSLRFDGISVMLLHHTNKFGGQRGTSGREDNLDISIMLKKPNGYKQEDGCHFIVTFEKHRLRNTDLPLIAPEEFQLIEKEGLLQWNWNAKNRGNKESEVLSLLSEGLMQKDIAAQLNISAGQVSKIKNKLVQNGQCP